MRTIKFRGMPIEDYGDTKWFYGGIMLNYDDKLAYIDPPGNGPIPVKWETVGEFTGLTDRNGSDIYEGDVLHHVLSSNVSGKVRYARGKWLCLHDYDSDMYEDLTGGDWDLEIIGNVHENKRR